MTQRTSLTAVLTTIAAFFFACGGDDGGADTQTQEYPYDPGTVTVVDNGEKTTLTPDANGCIAYKGNECVTAGDSCADGYDAADVYVDDNGKVIGVVCYPTENSTVDPITDANGSDIGGGNNSVIVVDGDDDGKDGADITGDVTLDGNNLVIYGEDPETSILDGNLTINQNNSTVTGITVTGNVTFKQNNASLSNCIVKGDVILEQNNNLVAGCTIFGAVRIMGNNNQLINNNIQQPVEVQGKDPVCEGNHKFTDSDSDAVLDDSEVGDAISCESTGNSTGNGKK